MLEINILRNSSQFFLVSWGVLFKSLGVQKKTPCWLRPWLGSYDTFDNNLKLTFFFQMLYKYSCWWHAWVNTCNFGLPVWVLLTYSFPESLQLVCTPKRWMDELGTICLLPQLLSGACEHCGNRQIITTSGDDPKVGYVYGSMVLL